MNNTQPKIDLTPITEAIEQLGKQTIIPLDKRLWNADDCAAYLRETTKQFLERIACLPQFPKRISYPTASGSRSRPKWKAIEVIDWAEKHQERR